MEIDIVRLIILYLHINLIVTCSVVDFCKIEIFCFANLTSADLKQVNQSYETACVAAINLRLLIN